MLLADEDVEPSVTRRPRAAARASSVSSYRLPTPPPRLGSGAEVAKLRTLQVLLTILGVVCVAIALSIFCLGAQTTAWSGERLLNAIASLRLPLSEPWPASMDSELRFYSILFGAYGVLWLRAALRLPDSLDQVPWLAAVFFAGGLGRAASHVAVGAPHPLFTVLMTAELATPPLLLAFWFPLRRARARG